MGLSTMRTKRTFRPTADGLESRDVPAAVGIASRIAHFHQMGVASRLSTPFAHATTLGTAGFARTLSISRTATAARTSPFGGNAGLNLLASRLGNNPLGSLLNTNQLNSLLSANGLGSLLSANQLGSLTAGQLASLINITQSANSSQVGSFGNTLTNGILSTVTNRNFPATLSSGGTGPFVNNNGGFGNTNGTMLVAGSMGFTPFI
jgi:hypothetical protein